MDERVGLPSYPDNFFDLAIVDPPYGSKNIQGGYTKGIGGKGAAKQISYNREVFYMQAPCERYFSELIRVSKRQIIWGANHFVSKIPIDSSCWIVWDKQNENTGYADCELALTTFNTAVRKATFRWNGMLQGDMKNKEKRIHPTQKPVKLYQWVVSEFCKIGDTILDTHVGSASSLIAFESMGFNYHGFEINPEIYQAARRRMSAGIQSAIF